MRRLCGNCGEIHVTAAQATACDNLHGGHTPSARLSVMSTGLTDELDEGDWDLPGSNGCYLTMAPLDEAA